MTTTRRLLTALTITVFALTGCSHKPAEPKPAEPKADVAACKTALEKQLYGPNFDPNQVQTTWPPECKGLDKATLDRLVQEIVDER